jgi:hypothetical protein
MLDPPAAGWVADQLLVLLSCGHESAWQLQRRLLACMVYVGCNDMGVRRSRDAATLTQQQRARWLLETGSTQHKAEQSKAEKRSTCL